MKKHSSWLLGFVAPLAFIAIILEADVIEGPKTAYVGVLSVVPMLSAVFAHPGITALVAVITWLSGYIFGLFASDGNVFAQTVRLVIIAIGGVLAVGAAYTRRKMQDELVAAQVAIARSDSIEAQANSDSMTGLLNRRGLTQAIKELPEGPRSIAILDCDQLKAVNDSHCHLVGDEYIIAIAKRLSSGVSRRDVIGRWGGDEFLVFVSAAPAEAHTVIQRLIASVADSPISTTAGPITATVTGGLAQWAPGEKMDTALRHADDALYAAKAAGRGQLVVADSATPSP
jgi:diguanylate cyclase (GGDEF)-like protein